MSPENVERLLAAVDDLRKDVYDLKPYLEKAVVNEARIRDVKKDVRQIQQILFGHEGVTVTQQSASVRTWWPDLLWACAFVALLWWFATHDAPAPVDRVDTIEQVKPKE